MTDTPPILDVQNAQVFRRNTQVFSNLSLTLRQGESVAIIGPNGAGKTTLLKLINRELYPVVQPNSFLKLFGEERIKVDDLRQKMGTVSFEAQITHDTLANGLHVVISAFFGSVGIHDHHQVQPHHTTAAKKIMDELGIAHLANRQYLLLSTGQQRRLLLARAMVHNPKVLVLDEPTSGLDLKSAFQLLADIRKLCNNGTTLILVTHHIQEIVPEINKVIFLKDGQVTQQGNKQSLLTDSALSALYDTAIHVSEHAGYYTAAPKA